MCASIKIEVFRICSGVNVGERAREIFMSELSVTLMYNHLLFLSAVHQYAGAFNRIKYSDKKARTRGQRVNVTPCVPPQIWALSERRE